MATSSLLATLATWWSRSREIPQWLVGTIDAASTASPWRKSVTSGPSRIKVVQLGVGGRQIEWL